MEKKTDEFIKDYGEIFFEDKSKIKFEKRLGLKKNFSKINKEYKLCELF